VIEKILQSKTTETDIGKIEQPSPAEIIKPEEHAAARIANINAELKEVRKIPSSPGSAELQLLDRSAQEIANQAIQEIEACTKTTLSEPSTQTANLQNMSENAPTVDSDNNNKDLLGLDPSERAAYWVSRAMELHRQMVDDETREKISPLLREAWANHRLALEQAKEIRRKKETWQMSATEFVESASEGAVPHRNSDGKARGERGDIIDVLEGNKPLSLVDIRGPESVLINDLVHDGGIITREIPTDLSLIGKIQKQKTLLVLPSGLDQSAVEEIVSKIKSLYDPKKVDRSTPFAPYLMGRVLGYNNEDINAYILRQFNNGTYDKGKFPTIESVLQNIAENAERLPEFLPPPKKEDSPVLGDDSGEKGIAGAK